MKMVERKVRQPIIPVLGYADPEITNTVRVCGRTANLDLNGCTVFDLLRKGERNYLRVVEKNRKVSKRRIR
jgi:hypothetical protein